MVSKIWSLAHALGNRSILADPRNPNMKDIINKKLKEGSLLDLAPSVLKDKQKFI